MKTQKARVLRIVLAIVALCGVCHAPDIKTQAITRAKPVTEQPGTA